MTKNPVINALAAFAYIFLVTLVMAFGTRMVRQRPDPFLAPVVVISLFTLSAAVMGYVFCYEPIQLYFSGKKKQALDLFLKTVVLFGGITTGLLILLFSEILP